MVRGGGEARFEFPPERPAERFFPVSGDGGARYSAGDIIAVSHEAAPGRQIEVVPREILVLCNASALQRTFFRLSRLPVVRQIRAIIKARPVRPRAAGEK